MSPLLLTTIFVSSRATYTIFAGTGLVTDIIVGIAIYRAGLLKHGSVFILAMCAIADGVIRLSAFAFYFGPSIMLQRNLGDDHRFGMVSYHITQLMFASFYMGSITELLIAVNRLRSIKRVIIDSVYGEDAEQVFTRTNCMIYAAVVYPAMIAWQYAQMKYTPCCK